MNLRRKILLSFSAVMIIVMSMNLFTTDNMFRDYMDRIAEFGDELEDDISSQAYIQARDSAEEELIVNASYTALLIDNYFRVLEENVKGVASSVQSISMDSDTRSDYVYDKAHPFLTEGKEGLASTIAIVFDESSGKASEINNLIGSSKEYIDVMENIVSMEWAIDRMYIYHEMGVGIYTDDNTEMYINFEGKIKMPDLEEIREALTDIKDEKDVIVGRYMNMVDGATLDYLEILFPIFEEGEVTGFVGADVLLEPLYHDSIGGVDKKSGTAAIISKTGYVLFSTSEEGDLAPYRMNTVDTLEARGLNEINKVVVDAYGYDRDAKCKHIIIDGKQTHVVGVAADNALNFVYLRAASDATLSKKSGITSRLLKDYNDRIRTERIDTIRYFEINSVSMRIVAVIVFVIIGFFITSILFKPIQILTVKVQSMDGENLNFEWDKKSNDETEVLANAFKNLIDLIKAYIKDLKNATAQKERVEAELSLASNIQENALPREFPPFPDKKQIDLYASMDAAREVGGDFYDFFMVDDNRLALVIADVSGKGVPAALFMMTAKSLIKSNVISGIDLESVFASTNRQLCEGNKDSMFVTAFLIIVNLETGECEYVNAGHEPFALKKDGGDFGYISPNPALMLGVVEDVEYKKETITLAPGDKLFLYTDGATDEVNTQDEIFGEENLLASINRAKVKDAESLLKSVKADIEDYYKGTEQFDDITMLCFCYKGK